MVKAPVVDETSSADPLATRTWRSRPGLARLARLSIIGVPFLLVLFAAWRINRALGPPAALVEALARWAVLSVLSTLALISIDRVAKQFLPLNTLLRLAIVFPDQAPSRFKLALRQGSTKHLAAEVASLEDASAQEAAEALLKIVGQLTAHDRLTRGHTERVRAYADLVAEEMGLNEEERIRLQWAGLLHDVGKITVPTEVLNKAEGLTSREWSRLQSHPNEGWKLVTPMKAWLGEWARSTRDHHERWDGQGYPRGLKGAEISRAGRIIGVVDAFDVMTTVRAYKSAMSHEEARAELATHAGTQFDPEVVRAFLAVSLAPQRTSRFGSWLANSPVFLQATSVAQVPAALTSAAAVALAATAVIPPVLNNEPAEQSAERIVVDDPPPLSTTTTIEVTSTSTSTTTSTTSTTTLAPSSTVAPTTTAPRPRPTTPPPAPTAAPTTTTAAPPVVVSVTTTTTLAPSTFDGGYLGAGGGGSTFGLVSSVNGAGALNWDSGDNADPGLTLRSGPGGLAEIDSPEVQAWSIAVADDTLLQGQASLRLYVATAGFTTDALGGVTAGIVDCANGTTSCTTIGSGSHIFPQTDFGTDFGVITINLGAIDYTVPAGHTLLVSMTKPQNTTVDTWLAFGTSTYPSQFRLN